MFGRVAATVAVPAAPPAARWAAAAARCSAVVFLGVAPVCLFVALVVTLRHHPSDFTTFWESGRAVLHGRSPYPSLGSLPAHADPKTFAPFVYPPVAAVAMVPLSLLPFGVAIVAFLLVDMAAVALALRLLGVTDWRCYGAAFCSAPVFASAGLGAISPLLLLGVAAAWRYRDHAVRVGLLVAYVATAKLFLWPVWLWLLRTRRFAAAAVAAGVAVAGVLGAWAAIGFAGLHDYPALLGRLTQLVGPESYSPYALGRSLGLGGGAAQSAAYLAGAAAIAAVAWRLSGDRRLLTAALAVSLLMTPILWPHYLVVLYVPIALARRRFTLLWLAPLAFWVDVSGWTSGSTARIAALLALTAATIGMALQRQSGGDALPVEQ